MPNLPTPALPKKIPHGPHKSAIATEQVLLGSQVEGMSDAELTSASIKATLFARLSPAHKLRIIKNLQVAGHVVGFMGDGTGTEPQDFDRLFAPLEADPEGALDGVQDMSNMPLKDESQRIRDDLDAAYRSGSTR